MGKNRYSQFFWLLKREEICFWFSLSPSWAEEFWSNAQLGTRGGKLVVWCRGGGEMSKAQLFCLLWKPSSSPARRKEEVTPSTTTTYYLYQSTARIRKMIIRLDQKCDPPLHPNCHFLDLFWRHFHTCIQFQFFMLEMGKGPSPPIIPTNSKWFLHSSPLSVCLHFDALCTIDNKTHSEICSAILSGSTQEVTAVLMSGQ